MSGRITSKSSNRLQIDTKHIWAQLIASKTKFPKSSASNRTTMTISKSQNPIQLFLGVALVF